jgi:TolA-binding protein
MGLEHAMATVNPNDLKALAKAARYTGHAALSLHAWQSLRARFATQPLGTQASFFLGRAYEEQGNATAALSWLGTYVSEAPSGAFASEALGRRVLLLAKTSGKAAAASSARDYLRRFPGGAYEKTARAIVEAE